MGCDIHYRGRQGRHDLQDKAVEFLRDCFSEWRITVVGPEQYPLDQECLVAYVHSYHSSVKKEDGEPDVLDGGLFNIPKVLGQMRRAEKLPAVSPIPLPPEISSIACGRRMGGQIVEIRRYPRFPYVGLVPWDREFLRQNTDNLGQRGHFIFDRYTGELCTLMLAEYFPSNAEWRRYLDAQKRTISVDEEVTCKIIGVAKEGGYWRDVGEGSGFFGMLASLKKKFMPDLEVSDDYGIWERFYQQKAE